jgi:hypothetical protein
MTPHKLGCKATGDGTAAECDCDKDHAFIVLLHKTGEKGTAVADVLTPYGWRVDYVTMDEHSGWTRVVFRHEGPL